MSLPLTLRSAGEADRLRLCPRGCEKRDCAVPGFVRHGCAGPTIQVPMHQATGQGQKQGDLCEMAGVAVTCILC